MEEMKKFERILEVNKFMRSAPKKNKQVHLNNKKVMYCLINYNFSHQNRISHNFIYYHEENSKKTDFIHKLILNLIIYLLVKSSSTTLISFDTTITGLTYFR